MNSFTESKQRIRELNHIGLEKCLEGNRIRYFGLPSPRIEDLRMLKKHLSIVHVVERGLKGIEWKWQHNLVVEAVLEGIPGFKLYRGDIDDLVISGHDTQGIQLDWPYNFINLDYTGGIIYKDDTGKSKRINALKQIFRMQGEKETSFFLAITVNDKYQDMGEISKVLTERATANKTKNPKIEKQLSTIQKNSDKRIAIFVYTSYIISETARNWFRGEILKPILYTGKGGYKMLNMSYCFKYIPKRDAPAKEYRDAMLLLEKGFINLDEKDLAS